MPHSNVFSDILIKLRYLDKNILGINNADRAWLRVSSNLLGIFRSGGHLDDIETKVQIFASFRII